MNKNTSYFFKKIDWKNVSCVAVHIKFIWFDKFDQINLTVY